MFSLFQSRSKRSADEDQEAKDATIVSTYAAHPYPLTYTTGFPYNAYNAPAFYSAGYTPLAYHGCTGLHGCTVYPGYTAPLVHSLKKRDTAAAEDQEAEEAVTYSPVAAHSYP